MLPIAHSTSLFTNPTSASTATPTPQNPPLGPHTPLPRTPPATASPTSPIYKAYHVTPLETFRATWTVTNKASIPWPNGVRISFISSTNGHIPYSTKCSELTRELHPGEQATFSVEMEAPRSEGEYISYWGLVTPGGQSFGSRLSCVTFVEAGKDRGGREGEMGLGLGFGDARPVKVRDVVKREGMEDVGLGGVGSGDAREGPLVLRYTPRPQRPPSEDMIRASPVERVATDMPDRVLTLWFRRGMLCGWAKSMMWSVGQILGPSWTHRKIMAWIITEKQRISTAGGKDAETLEAAVIWARRNRNPPSNDPTKWFNWECPSSSPNQAGALSGSTVPATPSSASIEAANYALRPRKRSFEEDSQSPSKCIPSSSIGGGGGGGMDDFTIAEITMVHQKISWIVENDWEDIARYAELVSGVGRTAEAWRAHWKGKALKRLIGGYAD